MQAAVQESAKIAADALQTEYEWRGASIGENMSKGSRAGE